MCILGMWGGAFLFEIWFLKKKKTRQESDQKMNEKRKRPSKELRSERRYHGGMPVRREREYCPVSVSTDSLQSASLSSPR